MNGTGRRFSDLDLMVCGEPLSPDAIGELRNAFTESGLCFRVDLIEESTTALQFWTIVDRAFVRIA